MRAEERKTGKIGAEVVTVGPGTGGNPLLTVGPGTGGNQAKSEVRRGWARKAHSGSLEDWVRRRRHKEVPAASPLPRPSLEETGKRDLVAKPRVT